MNADFRPFPIHQWATHESGESTHRTGMPNVALTVTQDRKYKRFKVLSAVNINISLSGM
jgi:hypothetical protein